jgi:hypothetical protein
MAYLAGDRDPRPQYNQDSMKGDTATGTGRRVERGFLEAGQIAEEEDGAITWIIPQEIESA